MKNLKILAVVISFFFIILIGCNKPINDEDKNDDTKTIEELPTISIDQSNYTVNIGENIQLNPTVITNNSSLKLIYTSNNTEIVNVDNNGLLTAVTGGEAIITISVEGYPSIKLEITIHVELTDQEKAKIVLNWAKEIIGSEIRDNVQFPSTHPVYNDAKITWTSSDLEILDEAGYIYQNEYDVNININIKVEYKDETLNEDLSVIIAGYAAELVASKFLNQFSKLITRTYTNLKLTDTSYPNAKITWYSSNLEVFTNDGEYIKPANDTSFIIYVTVEFEDKGITRTYQKEVIAQGVTIIEKTNEIEEEILKNLNLSNIVIYDLELPTFYSKYNATLTWTCNKPNIVSATGTITRPSLNQMVSLRCEVLSGNETSSFRIEFEVASRDYDEKWVAIEELLNLIFVDEIKTQRYTMFGVSFNYSAYNYGYLPFYTNQKSIIQDGMISKDRSIRTETRWIVIHDTANTNPGADAVMHTKFIQGDPGVSWHYTVDDKQIFQHLENNRTAAHAGSSEGNLYGIGIETCINQGVDYNEVMRKTAKLTSELMKQYDLTLYNVRQHNFFSGKDCPHVMRASNRWGEFLDLVSMEYLALTQLEGVEFVWQSITPNILDNTGRIFYHPGSEIDVSFKVLVTYNEVTKEYTHTAKLLSPSWL